MSLTSWLRKSFGRLGTNRKRRRAPRSAPPKRICLQLEPLEDRLTPSITWGGSFSEAPSGVEWAPPPPLLADVTSDGILDRINGGWMTVEPGLGDGTFADPIDSGAWASYLAVADFNADGRLDVVTADLNWAGDNPVGTVLLGRGDGTFHWHEYFDIGLVWPTKMGTGDFNGDGRTDVAITGDDWGGATAFVVLSNDGNWESLSPPPPTTPNLRLGDVSITEGNTGTASAIFTVTLSTASTDTITVTYTTGDGSASAGSDYQATSGTLTFAPGETSKTITVQVNGDRVGEASETFFVALSNPTNATIADGFGQGTITDDEPRVSINDVTKKEGNSNSTTAFTFTVTLSAAYDVPVTINFATANGTAKTSDNDYVANSGTITFAPGETTKTITVLVKGDRKKEANENFFVDLSDLSGYSVFLDSRGTGTIQNDD